MPNEVAEMALQAIEQIEAQESLLSIRVGQFPHLTKADREKTHRFLHKTAFPVVYHKPVTMTAEQALKVFNG